MLAPSHAPIVLGMLVCCVVTAGCDASHERGLDADERDAGSRDAVVATPDAIGLDASAPRDASPSPDVFVTRDAFVAPDLGTADAGVTPDVATSDASWDDAHVERACPADAGPQPDAMVSASTIDAIEMSGYADFQFGALDTTSSVPGLYRLSDGSTWDAGAGTGRAGRLRVVGFEAAGVELRVHVTTSDPMYVRTDYDGGSHSANFELDPYDDIVLSGERGARTFTFATYVRVALDQPANYADARFNHLSAPICAVVPFTTTYTIVTGARTFDEHLFDADFEATVATRIDLRVTRP